MVNDIRYECMIHKMKSYVGAFLPVDYGLVCFVKQKKGGHVWDQLVQKKLDRLSTKALHQ